MSKGVVCVSGVTGYIGAWVAKECLDNDYKVVGTVRSLTKSKGLEHVNRWKEAGRPIELREADLLDEKSWERALEGVDYVMHVASPFVVGVPEKDAEEKLTKPAVNGTLNVLQAALAKGVKKVVLTSSVASIMGGHKIEDYEGVELETLWSDPESPETDTYSRSKTLAERAAWKFYEEHKDEGFKLATINPSFVLGPPISSGSATSHDFIVRLLKRQIPMVPDMKQNCIDVRDVAKAHRLALESDAATGERLACTSSNGVGFLRSARAVKAAVGPYGYKIATMEAPSFALALLSFFDSQVAVVRRALKKKLPELSNTKIKRVLAMDFYDVNKTLEEHVHGIIQNKVDGVKMTKKYKEALESGEIKKYE